MSIATRVRNSARQAARLAALVSAGFVALATAHHDARAGSAAPPEPTACALEPGPNRAVTGVVDGETITLDDGSEVRLVGALSPRPPDSSLELSFWPPEREAKAALEQLVLGRSVTLGFAGRRTDRYGRTLAHVFVEGADGNRDWVQAHMLANGHARAFALKDNTACLRELAAHEAVARQAGLGLWRHAAYQPREAARAGDLMRLRSTFQLVEGTVTEMVTGKTTLILRFGEDPTATAPPGETAGSAQQPQRRDFSIAIKPRIARDWTAGDLTLERTLGQRLRIRGWIERRGGPAIEILDAHQIELIAPDAPPLAAAALEEAPPARRRSRRSRREAAVLVPISD